jgi:hypothetical protein
MVDAARHYRMLEVFKHVCSVLDSTWTAVTSERTMSKNLSWNMSRTRALLAWPCNLLWAAEPSSHRVRCATGMTRPTQML